MTESTSLKTSSHTEDNNHLSSPECRQTRYRQIKSYILRAGRMTSGQQRGWDEQWATLGLTRKTGSLGITQVFGRTAPTVLEIGFGMGHSLLTMALNDPDKNFIGIEVHRPGVGALLNNIGRCNLNNVRIYCDDAVDILSQCIPDNSLHRVQIYFPDPWHKKKHNKRRLIQAPFVKLLHTKLQTQGILHLATDWEHYAEHMMQVLLDEGWKNQAGDKNFAPRPDYRPLTKFEKRGRQLGHGVWDLLFECD